MSNNSTAADSSSKSTFWMTIALCASLSSLLGVGIFMASRAIRALEFRSASDPVTLRTPIGDWRVEKPNEVGPALPVYPDASLVLSAVGDVRSAPTQNNQIEVQTTTYHTNDPSDFVDNWYLKHLGSEFIRNNSADKAIQDVLSDARISNNDITFVGERGDQVRIVAIALDSTGTKITLVRSTKRKTK